MHEINNIDKRRRTIKMFSNYFLVALVIMVLTGVIVLAASGYDIDRSTGQVIQNGILLVETEPEDAQVRINGELESALTPARYPIPQGRYEVSIDKEGYRLWQSQVDVFGSRVNWLYYPRLIPRLIDTRQLSSLQNFNFIAQSPDQDSLLINRSTNLRSFSLFDLGASEVTGEPFVIPESTFQLRNDELVGQIRFIEWSPSGRFVLIEHTYSGQGDFIVIDLDLPAASVNLDRAYQRELETVTFSDNNDVIGVQQGVVFVSRLTDETAGEPEARLVREVIHSNGNTWIVREDDDGSSIATLRQPNTAIVSSSVATAEYDVSQWEGNDSVVVSMGNDVNVFKDVNKSEPELNIVGKVLELSGRQQTLTSPDGRFVLLVAPQESVVYDLETLKTYELELGSDDAIGWLDGYRLRYDGGGQLYVMDFNGDNSYQIVSYSPEYPVFVDERYRAIYSVGERSIDGQLILRESSLELE